MPKKPVLKPYVLIFQSVLVAMVISFSSSTTFAQEQGSETKEWRFSFITYIWITSMNGEMTVRGRTVDIDASFGDILDHSDSLFAFNGILTARKGRWGGVSGRHLYETGDRQFEIRTVHGVHHRPIGLFRIRGALSPG